MCARNGFWSSFVLLFLRPSVTFEVQSQNVRVWQQKLSEIPAKSLLLENEECWDYEKDCGWKRKVGDPRCEQHARGCHGSELVRRFSQFMLERLGIVETGSLEDRRLRVTIISRDTQYRRILNEADLVTALEKTGLYKVEILLIALFGCTNLISSMWSSGYSWKIQSLNPVRFPANLTQNT